MNIMNIKFLLCSFLLSTCVSAQADWFLRGTQNNWGSTPMVAGGTNTVELKNVVFSAAGSVKFDRYGDWSQNYGIGGANGGNIPVAAGTWNIKFFTDTKNWNISQVVETKFHLRGTHNAWAEGDLMKPVAGSSTQYEICRDFGRAENNPRFKVDANGGWGADAFPATDYPALGFTKIIIDSVTRKIVSVTPKLLENCAPVVGVLVFEKPGPFNLSVGEIFENPVQGLRSMHMSYSSSNPAVASVEGGRVTILAPGTATITARGVPMSESVECIRTMCYNEGKYVINVSAIVTQ